MRYSRRTRFLAAVVALFGLLFMQLAVAAYACPNLAPVQQRTVMLDASGKPMVDCPEVDKQSPSLCQAHTQKVAQSLDKADPPSIQPFTPIGLVASIVAPAPAVESGFDNATSFLRARSTAPPIAIRNCCFRL
jgi:hypothetical protein